MAKERSLEVTFMRGNPMPWPAALGCTVGGALCMALGYTVVPPLDAPGGDIATYVIAAVVMVPIVLVALGAVALLSFWRVLVFVGAILLANGLTHLLARAGGYRLTAKVRLERRRWPAFARYLERQGSLRDVGPAAVAIWGSNLVYGVLVGQADRVAAMLSPEVGRGDDLVVGEVIRKKTL